MSKQRNYYTVATYENGRWAPQFGDYVKSVASQERKDILSNGELRASHVAIIQSWDAQADIMKACETFPAPKV